MSEDELNTEIKISEYLKKNPVHRFKSYTIIIIVIVLILGLVFLTGAYGPDFFGIVIFLLIVSMPVIILFRYKLASILPKSISDNLLDIHHDDYKLKDLYAADSAFMTGTAAEIQLIKCIRKKKFNKKSKIINFLKKEYENIKKIGPNLIKDLS